MIRGNWKSKLRYVDEQKLIMIGAIKQIVGPKGKKEMKNVLIPTEKKMPTLRKLVEHEWKNDSKSISKNKWFIQMKIKLIKANT